MAEQGEVAAILLAAGASRRFGSDKLLHPVLRNGQNLPLIVHSLRPWLAVFRQMTVVVRPDATGLRHAVEKMSGSERLHWIECPDADLGMAASLACGVAGNKNAAGWLIGLADMPGVPEAAIKQVRVALEAGATLAAPFHDGRRGHPVGFSSAYHDELLALQGDMGARSLLERDVALVRRIDIDDPGILVDIDSPADLENL